jgi:hypothetical protein
MMKLQSGLSVVSAFFWTFWATLSLAGLIQHSLFLRLWRSPGGMRGHAQSDHESH